MRALTPGSARAPSKVAPAGSGVRASSRAATSAAVVRAWEAYTARPRSRMTPSRRTSTSEVTANSARTAPRRGARRSAGEHIERPSEEEKEDETQGDGRQVSH